MMEALRCGAEMQATRQQFLAGRAERAEYCVRTLTSYHPLRLLEPGGMTGACTKCR
jgi:hypothetical protein